MSGDWIKVATNLAEKPEVIAIADDLDMPETHVVGCLLVIWAWFDQHTEDGNSGNACSVTKTFLNRKVSVTGFAESMGKAGWLVEQNGVIHMPNFDTHNGKSAKKRAVTARRVAVHKANAKVTPTALPREEKRRIKEKEKKESPVKSGRKEKNNVKSNGTRPAYAYLPRDDNQLPNHAQQFGLPPPYPGQGYPEYRQTLKRAIDERMRTEH